MALREELEQALGSAYTLERELSGGGMSRVFVAEERALGRRVVVKVLPPEIAAGVNVDRFRREIQMAARLQHPHIVPVLSSGEMRGIPFYTMPFVEGESVRARLQRSGAVAITEIIGILRDVAKALAYAHDHGIVHRDIKPDNVLLSGGSATVADFGIAKAIAAARSGNEGEHFTLTQIGSSIGTPAYMAPEQAAADPATNHRADIYAFGCMAYELLAGRPPFTAKTPQRLLAAQMGEKPLQIADLRPDTPATLAELVMQCLEKDADARPQNAADMVHVLETVTSGGGHSALPRILLGGAGMFRRALAYYAAAFVLVMVFAQAAVIAIGLPAWVVPGAMAVMLMGLPVILFTGYVQSVTRRAMTMTPTFTPGGTPSVPQGTMATLAIKASPHVSWSRAAKGGMFAVGTFVLLVAGFMTLRALGIGPAGSLFAAGKLAKDERLLVADFGVKGSADSALGSVVAEAIRTDLAQSNAVNVAPASLVRSSLQRMRRPTDTRLTAALASEVAMREGIKAIVDGDVTPIGNGYIITARLTAPETGDELWSARETAERPTDVIPAVERLSRSMRAKIGESLRNVRASADLADVTTSSLEALRKYAEGARAIDVDRNAPRAIALFKEAIAIDSSFAMAWRKLGVAYNIGGMGQALVDSAASRAFQFSDRLPEVERLQAIGLHYGWGAGRDRAKATQAFEALVAISPTGYHNLAVQYGSRREYARAETLYRKNLARNLIQQSYNALIATVANQGRYAEAESLARAMPKVFPTSTGLEIYLVPFIYRRGRLDSAAILAKQLRANADPQVKALGASTEGMLAVIRGRLRDAERAFFDASALTAARGVETSALNDSLTAIWLDVWFRQERTRGARRLDAVLEKQPIRAQPNASRPYLQVAELYALAGRPDRAKAVIAQYQSATDTSIQRWQFFQLQRARGEIALAESRSLDALDLFRKSDTLPDGPSPGCEGCIVARIARAFDAAGFPDSAIVAYEQFFASPSNPLGVEMDPSNAAFAYRRLGELYEAKGNVAKAVDNYRKFVELWKDADPELQTKVAEVRRRIVRLSDLENR
jgi:eukaryotic-like serine/threonine-protein kinase